MEYIKVQDRFTATTWHRKIGDGPWVDMLEANPYWHDQPPVCILAVTRPDWEKAKKGDDQIGT